MILENKELNNKANHDIPDTHHYLQKKICKNSAQTKLEKTDEKLILENKELNNKANHEFPDTHHYLQKEICENSAQTELEKN